MSAVVEHAQVFMIAQEVFAAMVDGDAGLLQPWDGDLPAVRRADRAPGSTCRVTGPVAPC